ncbi:MAG TPA: type IX secretion system outer membrane channel protein PorV, partial [Flavitalea sp.]|nr:type IX secretion system outer membrane channel protein PorV [Flavitalea sp.]
MKNIFRKSSLLAPALIGISLAGSAQQTEKIDIVTTAVPFLRISPDARSGAMGETGIVTSPDANAQFYNVAKYPFTTDKSGIGMTYTPWLRKLGLKDVYLASVAGYYKIDDDQAFSGSLRYFSLGNLQLTDYNGNDLSTANPRELSVDAGYSRKLSNHLSLGIALRYIHSNLDGEGTNGNTDYKAGNAFAADLGMYYTTVTESKGGWNFGAVLSNLGTKISYSSNADQKNFLPANVGVGAGYTWITNEIHKLSLNGEV